MTLFAILLSLVSCGKTPSTGKLEVSSGQIINGQPATDLKYRSVVALVSKTQKRRFCSGNYYAQGKVMTAVHCVLPTGFSRESLAQFTERIEAISQRLYPRLIGKPKSQGQKRAIFRQVAREEVRDIGIYVGDGEIGPRAVWESRDIVIAVQISNAALDWAIQNHEYYKTVADGTADRPPVPITPIDSMTLIVKKEQMLDVTPTPLISEQDALTHVVIGQDGVNVAGFGSKADVMLLEEFKYFKTALLLSLATNSLDAELAQNLRLYFARNAVGLQNQQRHHGIQTTPAIVNYFDLSSATTQVYDSLKAEPVVHANVVSATQTLIGLLDVAVKGLEAYANISGDKQETTMGIYNQDGQVLYLGSLDPSIEQGTCFGDSGGPAFVEVNGERFQMGVVSAGNVCGSMSMFKSVTKYNH